MDRFLATDQSRAVRLTSPEARCAEELALMNRRFVPSPISPMPSFGQRTAAALQQLAPGTSAAPGGPVGASVSLERMMCSKIDPPSTQRTATAVETNRKSDSLQQRSDEVTSYIQAKNMLLVEQRLVYCAPRLYSGSVAAGSANGSERPICGFCKKNGELNALYTSHSLHMTLADGKVVVSCPVLRSLRCEICGATGDQAHTRSHCPNGTECIPIAVLLKNTARRCDGSLRKRAHQK